jgi:hypothetical protein
MHEMMAEPYIRLLLSAERSPEWVEWVDQCSGLNISLTVRVDVKRRAYYVRPDHAAVVLCLA